MKTVLVRVTLAAVLFRALAFAFWQKFERYGSGGADLMPLWFGARALPSENPSRYAHEV